MNEKFSPYEFIGVIAPGAVLVFGATLLYPELKTFFAANGFSVGDLGLFVILAFVAGHLLQSIGNGVEKVLWLPFGGMPTNWVLRDNQKLVAQAQRQNLVEKATAKFGLTAAFNTLSVREWYPMTRTIYADVHAAGRTERIDSFNRTYGLMRGVAAAFLTLAVLTLIQNVCEWRMALAFLLLGVMALYRTYRFGRHYGRELFVEYLRLNP